jgi:hypothetical protein
MPGCAGEVLRIVCEPGEWPGAVVPLAGTDIVAQRYDAGVRSGEQVAKDMVAVRIAATFAGGAVVGGLVGWAIADDDDDDDDNGDYSRGNIDIEDSNITINRDGDGDELEDLQRQVQDEGGDRQALQQAQREQTKLKVENERFKREAREKAQREQAKGELEQRYAQRQRSAAQASREQGCRPLDE